MHFCRLASLRGAASQSQVTGTALRTLSPLHALWPKQAPSSSLAILVFYSRSWNTVPPTEEDLSGERGRGSHGECLGTWKFSRQTLLLDFSEAKDTSAA